MESSEANTDQLRPLEELSSKILTGRSALFIFNEKGQKQSLDMVALSLQERQTKALERIATALEGEVTT